MDTVTSVSKKPLYVFISAPTGRTRSGKYEKADPQYGSGTPSTIFQTACRESPLRPAEQENAPGEARLGSQK